MIPKGPQNFAWPHNEPGMMRLGMQRQKFIKVIDGENLPGTKISKGLILMDVGWVSGVHEHRKTPVYIDVLECGPQGVLTLAGERLEHEIWTPRYESLYLPPGQPHVAIYPTPGPGELPDFLTSPDLLALETRGNPMFDDDIHPRPGYDELLIQRLTELGLIGRVTLAPGRSSSA